MNWLPVTSQHKKAMDDKNISAAILELRKASGLTQPDFAIRLGIRGGSSAVSKFERDIGQPQSKTMAKMADLADKLRRSDLAEKFRGQIEGKIGATVLSGGVEDSQLSPIITALSAAAQNEDALTLKMVRSALRRYLKESEEVNRKSLSTGGNSSKIGATRAIKKHA
jgi:transcriptional regulator with XRE-family HTH domain